MARKQIPGEREQWLFLCNDAVKTPRANQQEQRLITSPKREKDKIHLEIATLEKRLTDNLSDVMQDLLEIATLVYVAGQVTSRGTDKGLDYGYKWFRDFELVIPVREYGIWSEFQVKELLEEILTFVSGEKYQFHFTRKSKGSPGFLGWKNSPVDDSDIKEVVLFSGGLDSFCGAVKEVQGEKKKIALVSHCSETKITGLQNRVYHYIKDHCEGPSPLHVPAKIWKGGLFDTKDTNQRNRSFLYAALGAAVAKTISLNKVRFYENGIISCNLPFDGQTYQARRTRTTHPRFLFQMTELIEMITGEDFKYENLYAYKTRADIIQEVINAQKQTGITLTRSCAKSRFQGEIRHDGVCSQCIDRRFAIVANECSKYESKNEYKINIFTDELEKTQDRTMVLGFAYLADFVERASLDAFYSFFKTDLIELANYIGPREETIKIIYNLYKRYAKQVNGAIDSVMRENLARVRTGTKDCLLSMVFRQEHKDFLKLAKQKTEGFKKHGKGQLNEKIKHVLEINPNITAPDIVKKIGNNTKPDTIRQTQAWKNRKK